MASYSSHQLEFKEADELDCWAATRWIYYSCCVHWVYFVFQQPKSKNH